MTHRILATARSFCRSGGPHLALLESHGCQVDLRAQDRPLTALELGALVGDCDGIILGLDDCDASVIAKASRLKVISRYGVGVDRVDLAAAKAKGITVTNAPGTNTVAVAELTLALILALARNIPKLAIAARAGLWERSTGWELSGKTIALVGLGAIGRAVAARVQALGMQVLAYDPYLTVRPEGVTLTELELALVQADIVSLHTALTPETENLMSRAQLFSMKKGAYLINTARGGLVDEMALYDALSTKHLAGAAMDAFKQEPPEQHPLLALDSFIATPHIGATTHEAVMRMSMLAAQNLIDVLEAKPTPYKLV